jgi:hypothetical protein
MGSIQQRGRAWWMIYRDIEGRTIQENAQTEDQATARRRLAARALERVKAQAALLRQVLRETPAKEAAGSRGNGPATRDSRPGANRKVPAKAARARRTNPRQGSSRKGEAA